MNLVISACKPNIASLGYALFLAVNASSVWGGVFPFLPIGFQTEEIVMGFFTSQSLSFMMSYCASAVGSYWLPGQTRRFLVKLVSMPYFLGWCFLIAAIYLADCALPLVICGGALLGLGSAGYYMLWQRLFASRDPDTGTHDLILGTVYAAPIYFSLYLIPQAITAFLIPLVFLPLFGLSLVLESRSIDRAQPMFEDVPHDHPTVYRKVIKDYWRSALSIGALGFCAGIMRSIAIGDPSLGSLVNMMSMAGMFIAAGVLLALWQVKNLQISVVGMYRIVFPFVITSLLLLPLLPSEYCRWLAATLYAVHSAAIMLMMIQCAQASRDRGINPVFIYGFFGGIVYALHDVGFISGSFAEFLADAVANPMSSLGMVALLAVYLLGLMHFIGLGGFRAVLDLDSKADRIEFVAIQHPNRAAPAAPRSAKRRSDAHASTSRSTAPALKSIAPPPTALSSAAALLSSEIGNAEERAAVREEGKPGHDDRFSRLAQAVREQYRLSARETEVMELIARGNSVARIAEMLVVSENTIRTHSKRIYAKLDVHKKQELIDLVESFDAMA